MTLAYEGMDMESEAGLTLTIYCAEPGTDSAERMRLLASWAASEELEARAAQDESSAPLDSGPAKRRD